eukprot:jgi/Botrbrau1/18550/Bobra.0367s0002.2
MWYKRGRGRVFLVQCCITKDDPAEACRSAGNAGLKAEIVRSGVRVAILGKPNAGKSSLLNCLAQREAAIVSPTPGTTRDPVEVSLDLAGHKVVLTDTAGLRETVDPVEKEGIVRSLEAASAAHVLLLVLDASSGQVPDLPHPSALRRALCTLWHEALQLDPGKAEESPSSVSQCSRLGQKPQCQAGSPLKAAMHIPHASRDRSPMDPDFDEPKPSPSSPQCDTLNETPLIVLLNKCDLVNQIAHIDLSKAETSSPSAKAVTSSSTSTTAAPRGDPAVGTDQRATHPGGDRAPCVVAPAGGPLEDVESPEGSAGEDPGESREDSCGRVRIVRVSCKTHDGLGEAASVLTQEVQRIVAGGAAVDGVALVTRVRHKLLLEEAMAELRAYLTRAQEAEVAAEHLRAALRALSALSGRAHSVEHILGLVMEEFCIGK